jgi:hypothetical protein
MARSVVLPVATYPAGTRVIGPVNIQNNLSRIVVEIQRCTSADPTIWPSETARLHVVWEFSTDGGQTWLHWITTEDWGGITVHSKTGLEIPVAMTGGTLPIGTQRRVRSTLTLDEPIRTGVVIDVT